MSATFSNILLAFDGSESSIDALKKAECLAMQNDAHLTVVYVKEPSNNPILPIHSVPNHDIMYEPLASIRPHPDDLNGLQKEVPDDTTQDTIFAEARVRLFSDSLHEVNYEVLEGNPAHEICDYAKQKEIDLIVIGNRGISGIKKLVMGSVSHQVTSQSDCPVLVCK